MATKQEVIDLLTQTNAVVAEKVATNKAQAAQIADLTTQLATAQAAVAAAVPAPTPSSDFDEIMVAAEAVAETAKS